MARYAFIAGSNAERSPDVETLQYCAKDTSNVSRALKSRHADYEVHCFPETGEPADLISEFESLAMQCVPGDTVLFYFSGHGFLSHSQLFLVWNETEFDHPVSTAIPVVTIKSIFAHSRAQSRFMVLDCCHSGAASEETYKSIQARSGETLESAARDGASLILAACGRNAVTRESVEFGGGYLTSLLCRALTNDFERADRDRDGMLSFSDLMGWMADVTRNLNDRRKADQRLDVPELFGQLRGDVFLTAQRLETRSEFEASLREKVLEATLELRTLFEVEEWALPPTLQRLARPIKAAAPTFENLSILDELFKTNDSAAIFAAATILQIRRDPRYMEKLISYVDNPNLRGATVWRILRAIRDTIPSYVLSGSALDGLCRRLKRAAKLWDLPPADRFERGEIPNMILQVGRRLGVPNNKILTKQQAQQLAD